MEDIPVSFDYKGKHYEGFLSEVTGGGGSTWHLMIDKYYCGALHWTPYRGFWFSSQTGEFEDIADYFSEVVIAATG
jgi:hypothetical protein